MHLEKKFTYPTGLYEYLVRKANSAVGERFIAISFPNIRIKFLEINRIGKWSTIDWLFEELSKRLVKIKEKYELDFGKEYKRKEVQINYIVEKTFREIIISGFNHIPIKSFGNILTVTVWSWIVFSKGVKPNETEETKRILENYTEKFSQFKKHWNRAPRKKIPLSQPMKCHICGKEAKYVNRWLYEVKGVKEEVSTPVCERHRYEIM
ncbi:MAG: hypothetical protein ACTSQE_03580 [Candidatus Heimdallarchaeaceae archaeon]